MNFKKTFLIASMTSLVATGSAPAFSENASQTSSAGALSIAASPLISITGHPFEGSVTGATGSGLIVSSIVEGTTDTLTVVFKAVADGSKATVAVSTNAARKAGLSVGAAVNVVSEATGYALIASGQLLAFIPNEAGKALLHHSRVDAESGLVSE
ncbi:MULTISPECIES: hypothetical protein [Paraburkholderia]|uniref:DUF5666 domain-containing protein n=2 Tax=Paraburkholderia tropica TaxID=92647 RepID=A0A1A5XB77_9BURK|nr:hypothetical protein [Paraburkholderia tropica]MBB2980411.1 hypothetical protein [Paraburkholderia tropica]MBB3000331.1 hypothetical protein [Paraburkholderia tropica]MBB6319961.1 hypothetical protein [Paraburkholderia tropica]MDE1144584.1 hypothetical protein [Paraburkholderia tropica]OBR50702.1 hypothetical protein A6456_02525 [Paraburkholderia tropica]